MKKHLEEFRKKFPFITAPKIIKYLGINLAKGVNGLYTENYKSLVQQIEEDRSKWEDFFVFMDRKITIIKIPYSKAFHKFKVVTIKDIIVFFTKIEKKILKFAWNHKITVKKKLKKKNKAGDIMLLDFKLYYKLS